MKITKSFVLAFIIALSPISIRAGVDCDSDTLTEDASAESGEVGMAVHTASERTESVSNSRHKNNGKVGLVLSGGGAKGIAHVGVIKALEENDIPIDYVTGTSMGAIVGSLYSCGWSPERMLEFFTTPDFLDWSQGIINKNNLYYYYQQPPTPKWVEVNVNFGKKESLPNQIIPTSLVSPLPMNIEFLRIFGPYSEQCHENFNDLFVPFRCVASDVYHKHKVVFSKGSLGESVRASMSFPLVFRPIEIDGVLMYDGGIYDNFPVNVMENDFDPGFIIGVSVSGADTKPQRGDMYSQLEDMIIQNNDYSLPRNEGIKIQVPVLNFGVLQFDKARTIYEIGYKTGLAMVDSIKDRISARRSPEEVAARREKFAAATPQLDFDSIRIEGIEGSPARYLDYLFTSNRPGPYSIDKVTSAYYRAVTDGSLSNLVPELVYRPDGDNTLLLKATPRRPWTFAVGGYVTTSTNSMLYFSGAYHTMGHNSLDMSLSAWVGQAYFAGMANIKFALRNTIPSYFDITGVMSKQKYTENDVLFFKSSDPMFINKIENYLRAGYVWAMGKRMKGYARLAGGYISDSYYPSDMLDETRRRDRCQYWVGLVRAGVEANSLDFQMYPSEGTKWFANIDLSYQSSRFSPFGQPSEGDGWKSRPVAAVELLWTRYFPVGRHWSFGLYGNAYGTLQQLDQDYTNVLAHAPAFAPTPSTKNYFNIAFRSDNYLAAGFIPMWKPVKRMQVRGDFYLYMPMRHLVDTGRMNVARYDGWFRTPRFLGELAVIYNLPFASLSFYGNYLSYPSHNWNFGISFGLYFKAPSLLRHND